MDTQPSTSTGAMDQRRKDALKAYREVLLNYLRNIYARGTHVMYSYLENAAARNSFRELEEPYVVIWTLLKTLSKLFLR
jgi:hypothetical protein